MKETQTSITFRCSETMRVQLETEAKRQQRPLSNLVKLVLAEYLKNKSENIEKERNDQ